MENQTKKWTYLIVDLEMTGLNPFIHGVLEVGAMVLDEKLEIIDEFFMDLCPPDNIVIDPEALEYNGFTLDRIAAWKSYEEFIDFFEVFIESYFPWESKPIMIGQYVTADIAFLSSIFHYTNRHTFFNKLGNDIIDTKSMANQRNALARLKWLPLPFASTSLSKPGWLSERLGITGYEAHTARGDILATLAVFKKFLGL